MTSAGPDVSLRACGGGRGQSWSRSRQRHGIAVEAILPIDRDCRPAASWWQHPFDAIADAYEAWYATPLGSFVIAQEEQTLIDAVSGPPGRVLDVGAGTGWWSRILAQRGFSVTALEPSAAMRRVGTARNAEPIEWVAGTAELVPFPDAAFDIVLLMTVLEFLAQPQRALAEAWRVVRPGGLLVVGHLDALSPWAALYRRLGDRGLPPWTQASFVESDDVASWLGRPTEARWSCVFLAPSAEPPFEDADRAGRRAGNAGALTILCWRKPV
jgi:ubiquinone/menaquinone biosynthesis C-methylase UbiE